MRAFSLLLLALSLPVLAGDRVPAIGDGGKSAQQALDRAQASLKPESTGEEMLDDLLGMWSHFAFDTARDAIRTISKPDPKFSNPSAAGISLPRPVATGDESLDSLLKDWWSFSQEMTVRLRGIVKDHLGKPIKE